MAGNRGQGECRGTASKNKGRHQEEVERPTGESTFRGSKHKLAIQRTGSGPRLLPHKSQHGRSKSWHYCTLRDLLELPEDWTLWRGVDKLFSPPTEDAPSDDSNSGLQDLDQQPGPSGTTGQSVTTAQSTTDHPPSVTKQHSTHPASPHLCPEDTSISSVPTCTGTPVHTSYPRQSRTWGQWHTVQGTGAQGNRDTGRTAVHQGEDRPREPTLQEPLTNVLGAYQQSQDMMSQILNNMQENKRLQEERHQEIREHLQALNTTMNSIAGVLADMANIMREWTAQQRAPPTSQSIDQPSTYATVSGQEAPPQDPQATSTPPPAEGEPPHKRSLRTRQKPETLAKTKTTTRK
ncbi:hypothetical protein NDU88_006450 [Pleurodeles waltl]|uniref:Uncharacterized protein n=1 Tax=Pleurodeles waltl TaxID=8319 RepID=A0AAV7QP40_PLEWA|nr:hypothetical protein NDU88_006450 [Pleurodeles waltl]